MFQKNYYYYGDYNGDDGSQGKVQATIKHFQPFIQQRQTVLAAVL